MGMFDKALKNAAGRAVGNAVGNAASRAVGRTVERKLTDTLNQAVDKATPPPPDPYQYQQQQNIYTQQQNAQAQAAAAQLGGIFGSFAGAAQSYANEAAKNLKICPGCGNAAGADQAFCPSCGTRLPEQTAAQGAVCQGCGRQNGVGTKFCAGCGMKLPAALAEEEAAQARNAAVLARWDTVLPQYPKWTLGGSTVEIEEYPPENGYPCYTLTVCGAGLPTLLAQYSQILKQNGFVAAGQYPSESQLFKRVGGVVYSFSSDNAFDGGMDHMILYYSVREPQGGFDYRKPEPQKAKGWKDMLGL